MLRFAKPTALVLALMIGLLGLGEMLAGNPSTGSGTSPVLTPSLQAILNQGTEPLEVSGQGTAGMSYSFRLTFSIGGGMWQQISLPGTFDALGSMNLSLPLSLFQGYDRVDAIMDLSVIDTSASSLSFLTSMPWGMAMRSYEAAKLRGSPNSYWEQWQAPLPGTTSPTFTMSMGSLPSLTSPVQRPNDVLIFVAGPSVLLQAYAATGIEGMLPVN